MKSIIKILAVLLALMMVLTSLIACGGSKETETDPKTETTDNNGGSENQETEDPRLAVKDDIPADLNYSGANDNTITFFVRNDSDGWKYEMDVDEITNDTLWDSIYERNRTVEARLGVEITTIGQLGAWGKHTEWFQTLRNAVNTKSGDFDTAAIYLSQGASLAVEGMYYNLYEFPNINLSKPWWNQSICEEATLFDALYFLSGDIAYTETNGGKCLFFNKTMFERLYGTRDLNLYDIVEAGEWTIDLFYELVEGAWEDTNSSGITDNGDIVGLNVQFASNGNSRMDSWIPALGLRITSMPEGFPVLSLYNERSVAAFEKLQNLYEKNVGTLQGDAAANPDSTFATGKALFDLYTLSNGGNLRDMTDPYGVLPLPKFDEEQESYGTNPDASVSLVVVLSSCFDDKVEMVGATLELMAAESYRKVTPTFYEVVLKSKYSNDPRDADMYDLILNSFVYDFGFIYAAQMGGISGLFRNTTVDFAQLYESNETSYETALENLIDKLDEIAFNAQNN